MNDTQPKQTQAPAEPAPRCYRIIRQFHPSTGRKSRTIKSNVTLAEAQAHCSDPSTRKPGAWFDGYDYMKGCRP